MCAFCPVCGTMALPKMDRCMKCGYRFDGSPYTPTEPPKTKEADIVRNDSAPFLPYAPRPMQLDIIADIKGALMRKRHIVLESGTGTGKTIVSLASSLEFLRSPGNGGKKIIYITRTNSQSDQVMKELRSINNIQPVTGITLSGRNRSCPLLAQRPDFEALTPNSLSLLCTEKKQKTQQEKPGGCPYYAKALSLNESVKSWAQFSLPESEVFDAYCTGIGVCPYEARKMIMKDFDVIVAPYIHILDENIRNNLFANLGLEEKDIILVVDEAHNLIDQARQMESFSIHSRLIVSALDECQAFSNAFVSETLSLSDFIRVIRTVVENLADRYIAVGSREREHLLQPSEFEDAVCALLGRSVPELNEMVDRFSELAEKRMESIADTDNPFSPLGELSDSLVKWVRSKSGRYVKAIKVDDDGAFLSAACIDPSSFPAFLNRLEGSVHMSGTLQPVSQYARVMGLPDDTIPRKYPSPFPKENRRTIYSRTLTTNYKELNSNPRMFSDMERTIAELCNLVHKNTMVFVTSYGLMGKLRKNLEKMIRKPAYWEEPGRSRRTMNMVAQFKKESNAVFFCVMGGSVAEGIDFPGDQLCFAIIVGMPYPPRTLESVAMSDMFDARYGPGKGWEYVSAIPAVRKIRQASGRLIRRETDRGMTVILDYRAQRNARELEAVPSDDVVKDVREFFEDFRCPQCSNNTKSVEILRISFSQQIFKRNSYEFYELHQSFTYN